MSKDDSGFTPQERHDIIMKCLDDFGKNTKCFQLRWREGELLDGKILSSTPMFWYMKYFWTRKEIEELFFNARIVIDPVFDQALNQVFGGEPGPRWKGGGPAKKEKWKKNMNDEKYKNWYANYPPKEKNDDNDEYGKNIYEYKPKQKEPSPPPPKQPTPPPKDPTPPPKEPTPPPPKKEKTPPPKPKPKPNPIEDNPIDLLNKLLNRDRPWRERNDALNKINNNLGKNNKYNELLSGSNIPTLLCAWSTQLLDNKNDEIQNNALKTLPNIFKECLEKGNPKNIAVGSLQEILDNLFAILDDPSLKRHHQAARDAVDSIVDQVIATDDPDAILFLAGLLSEKMKPENISDPNVRRFALEQLQKIIFGKNSPYAKLDGTNRKIPKVEESKLPKKGTSNREWLDIATENQIGPSEKIMNQRTKYTDNQKLSDDDEKNKELLKMNSTEIGNEFRNIMRDSVGTMVLDPNQENSTVGMKLADILSQLTNKDKKFVDNLDGDATQRYYKWKFSDLKPYNPKPLPKNIPQKKNNEPALTSPYLIKQETPVNVNQIVLPDI